MKEKVFYFLIILLCSLPLLPEKKSVSRFYIFNLSLFHPLSINQSKLDSVAIDISFFYSHVGFVRGVSLGIGVGVVEKEVKGLQMYGIAGISLLRLSGAQFSGMFNINGGQGRGLQMAGVFNINHDRFSGIQWALMFNINRGDFIGSQGAFLLNFSRGEISGVQTSALINVAGSVMKGLQAGILNIGQQVTGLQLGIVNLSKKLHGVQIGLFNFTRKGNGVQMGIFNVAPGLKVGITVWGGNSIALNTGIKLLLRDVYTILYSGGIDPEHTTRATITYGICHGHRFSFGKFFLNLDGGYQYLDRGTFFKSRTGHIDSHMLSLRASIGFKIYKKFSLLVGSGIAYQWDVNHRINSGDIKPLFFTGMEIN